MEKKKQTSQFDYCKKNFLIKVKTKPNINNAEKKQSYTIDTSAFNIKIRKSKNLGNNTTLKNPPLFLNFTRRIKKTKDVEPANICNNNDEDYFITKLKKIKQRFPSNKKDFPKSKTSDKIIVNRLLDSSGNKITIDGKENKTMKTSIKSKKKAVKIKKLNLSLKKSSSNEKDIKKKIKISRVLSGNSLNNMTITNPYSLYVFNNPINLNYNDYSLNENNTTLNNYLDNPNVIYSFRLSPIVAKKYPNNNGNRISYSLYNSPKLYNNIVFRNIATKNHINDSRKGIKEVNTIESYKINIGKLLKNTKNEESPININSVTNNPMYFSMNLENYSIKSNKNKNIINTSNWMSNNVNNNGNTVYHKPLPKPENLKTPPYKKKNMIKPSKKLGNSNVNSYIKKNMGKLKKSFNIEKNDILRQESQFNIYFSPVIQNNYTFKKKIYGAKIISKNNTENNWNKIEVNRTKNAGNKSLNFNPAFNNKKNPMNKVRNKSRCFLQKYYNYYHNLQKQNEIFITY